MSPFNKLRICAAVCQIMQNRGYVWEAARTIGGSNLVYWINKDERAREKAENLPFISSWAIGSGQTLEDALINSADTTLKEEKSRRIFFTEREKKV